jgi:alkylhydroperoxidase family enzyme
VPNIPYKNLENYEPKHVLDAVIARRGPAGPLNLDKMLLHSPVFAEGWGLMLGRVRRDLNVDIKLRELAMCGVAQLNGAEYEFIHHAPLYVAAGGTTEKAEALRKLPAFDANLFDAAEIATLRLTTEMTRDIKVKPETIAAVRAVLPSNQDIVELVGVVAAYNMVSRFLVALGVEPE